MRSTLSINKEHKYQIVIYWSYNQGVFIAEVPELEGCVVEAATQKAALEAVQSRIESWLESVESEGREIPEPQGDLKMKPQEKQGRGARRQERIEKRRRSRERARQERGVDPAGGGVRE